MLYNVAEVSTLPWKPIVESRSRTSSWWSTSARVEFYPNWDSFIRRYFYIPLLEPRSLTNSIWPPTYLSQSSCWFCSSLLLVIGHMILFTTTSGSFWYFSSRYMQNGPPWVVYSVLCSHSNMTPSIFNPASRYDIKIFVLTYTHFVQAPEFVRNLCVGLKYAISNGREWRGH